MSPPAASPSHSATPTVPPLRVPPLPPIRARCCCQLQSGLLPLRVNLAASAKPDVFQIKNGCCATLQEEDTPPQPGAKPRGSKGLVFNPPAYKSPGLPAAAAQPGLASDGADSIPRLFMPGGRGVPAKPACQRLAEGAAPSGAASSSTAGAAGKLCSLQGRCVAAQLLLTAPVLCCMHPLLPATGALSTRAATPLSSSSCRPAVPLLDLAAFTATAAAAAAATTLRRGAPESAQPAVRSSACYSSPSLAMGGGSSSQPIISATSGQRQAVAAAADEPADADSPPNKKRRPALSPPRLVIDCQLYEFTAVKAKVSEAACQLAPAGLPVHAAVCRLPWWETGARERADVALLLCCVVLRRRQQSTTHHPALTAAWAVASPCPWRPAAAAQPALELWSALHPWMLTTPSVCLPATILWQKSWQLSPALPPRSRLLAAAGRAPYPPAAPVAVAARHIGQRPAQAQRRCASSSKASRHWPACSKQLAAPRWMLPSGLYWLP
jgi:hypothetical protein